MTQTITGQEARVIIEEIDKYYGTCTSSGIERLTREFAKEYAKEFAMCKHNQRESNLPEGYIVDSDPEKARNQLIEYIGFDVPNKYTTKFDHLIENGVPVVHAFDKVVGLFDLAMRNLYKK